MKDSRFFYKLSICLTVPIILCLTIGGITLFELYHISSLDTVRQLLLLQLVVLSISFLVVASLLFNIRKLILRPINKLSNIAEKISEGFFDNDFEIGHENEFEKLAGALRNINENIMNIINSTNEASISIMAGDIGSRVDENLFSGGYKKLAASYNELIQQLVNDNIIFIQGVEDIGKGDFFEEMPEMPGKKAYMENSLCLIKNNLSQLTKELDNIILNIKAGYLHQNINFKNYGPGWKKLISKVNELLLALSAPISEASRCLDEISEGNFDARVDSSYKGEFNMLNTSINKAAGVIVSYINDASEIINSITQNNISQVIGKEYPGYFSPIKSSVNLLLNRLNDIFINIGSISNELMAGLKVIRHRLKESEGVLEGQASYLDGANEIFDILCIGLNKTIAKAQDASTIDLISKESLCAINIELNKIIDFIKSERVVHSDTYNVIRGIGGIAFQANLLALNADVEAMRAGVYGKGFAAIAKEIKLLALKTQNAVNNIEGVIKGSIIKTDKVISVASLTSGSLESTINNIGKAIDIFEGITSYEIGQVDVIYKVLANISGAIKNNMSLTNETFSITEGLLVKSESIKTIAEAFDKADSAPYEFIQDGAEISTVAAN